MSSTGSGSCEVGIGIEDTINTQGCSPDEGSHNSGTPEAEAVRVARRKLLVAIGFWAGVLVAVVAASAIFVGVYLGTGGDGETVSTDYGCLPADERNPHWKGKVVNLAVNSWTGSALTATTAAIILGEYMGMQVTLHSEDEYAMWAKMVQGEVDACLEVWPSGHSTDLQKYIYTDQTIASAGPLGVIGKIGWYFPSYVLDKYPQAANFNTMTSESRNTVLSYFSNTLYDGPSSWVSYDHEIIENNGWNMTVTSIETEEQLLETVYAAAAAKDPILFYMWTPHQIFGKYDLSRVSLPPYSTDCYADLDEVYCDYPDDILVKVYRKNFLDQSTLRVLQSFNLYNFDQIKMLSAVAYNGSTVEVAACNWVRKNRETWMQWIPPEPDNILRIALPSVIIPLVFIFCLGAGIASICHFRMKNKVAEEVVDLENQNAQLKLALMKTQDTTDFLNTPAETVVKMIEEFRKRHDWSPTELEDFNFIIKVISSRKLYTFDNEKTSQFLEEDVKDYLFDVTAIPRSKDVSAEQPENTLASSQQSHTSISEVIDKHFFDNVEQWEWDAISFANHSESNYLVHLANYIFDTHGFFEQLPLNRQKFNNFMDAVQKGYLDNPYHSGIHAADVTQALHLWIQQCSNAVCFTALELFSLLFSSLVHDLGHPGFNNNFMMASEDELALLYNDISILENYHVSYAFRLLKRPQCNFIEAMTPEQYHLYLRILLPSH
ncbi:glycine/betaine ABC transporter substrate-binding protein [Pelomyxa schiedti]|nr:glycine/betaine ABC transporter substrate-binding protein [Pelomyxa schiedti]